MSDAFIAHLQDLFAELGTVTSRKMFGGYGLYRAAVIFAIVADDVLYLKVDDETKAQFEAAGCAPFVYLGHKQPVTMSYWSVPEAAMESPQDMRPWAELAFAASLRKVNTPKKRASRKPKGGH